MSEVQSRRVKFLMVNPTDFMYLFTTGMKFRKSTHIVQGLPADAKLIHMTYDDARRGILLIVESEEFDLVPVTDHPPVLLVEIAMGKPKKHS